MSINDVTKEQILAWLMDHEQAFEDFCNYFDINEANAWFDVDNERMSKEDYYESLAECFINAYVNLSRNAHKLYETEDKANRDVSDEINSLFPCHGDEQMYIFRADPEKAYGAYSEQDNNKRR